MAEQPTTYRMKGTLDVEREGRDWVIYQVVVTPDGSEHRHFLDVLTNREFQERYEAVPDDEKESPT